MSVFSHRILLPINVVGELIRTGDACGATDSDRRQFPWYWSASSRTRTATDRVSTAGSQLPTPPMNSIDDRLNELESALDDQQAQIEAHEETIAAQQATIEAQRERLAAVENSGGVSMPMSRRGALTAGGVLGLLGLGAGTASAQGSGQIGTSDRPVETLYTQKLSGGLTNGSEIRDLVGFGLEIYETDGRLDVNWDNADGLDEFGKIRSDPILELITESDMKAGHILGGHSSNSIEADFAAVISGGGGDDSESNRIWEGGNYGTIGGGASNEVGGLGATIAGGGGVDQTFVGNAAHGDWTAIGGGRENTAEGTAATVPGGDNNAAAGDYSFAVGREAKVKEEHNGAFVVGDSSTTEIESQNENEARFQMNVVAEDVIANGEVTADSDVIAEGNVVANAFELVDKQGEPMLNEGEGILYISDGSEGDDEEDPNEGDLVYGYNDAESTETVVVAEKPDNGEA